VPSRFQQERFSAWAKGKPPSIQPGPFWESRRQEPLPSSNLRVQQGTRRMQPACFARAQVRPARRGPPTGDYTATTLRPGSPHSKQQKPLPSRRQQERFSPLAKGNPLRYNPDRFGKADVRSPCFQQAPSATRYAPNTAGLFCQSAGPPRPPYRRLPSGQVHPTVNSRSPCRPDVRSPCFQQAPSATRYASNAAGLFCQSAGPPSPPRPPYRRLHGNYPQARFTPQQAAEAPAVQTSTGKVLSFGQR
jgi:hypothetical protein